MIDSCAPTQFAYMWSLALPGRLTDAYVSFTKPHYGAASMRYMSF